MAEFLEQKKGYDRKGIDEASLKEINFYLDRKYKEGQLRQEFYEVAKKNVLANIRKWTSDANIARFSKNLNLAIQKAIEAKREEDLIYAFMDDIAFGTGGIRGLAVFTSEELRELACGGIDAPIVKGPNMINDIVLLLKSSGVANYATERGLEKVVIGYDSRIQGKAFAHLIARTFLARGLTVFLFDEACPFPVLTFAVPFLKANIGILISASHNDKRYNGYKLTSSTGAQFELAERSYLYENYIRTAKLDEIQLREFEAAERNQLFFLGGDSALEDEDYYGRKLINIYRPHMEHIKNFILDEPMLSKWAHRVNVGYCAFHGSGRKVVPSLLKDYHFTGSRIIHSLDRLDGMFPCFALEQQPDPGDPVAAEIAVDEFKKEYGNNAFEDLDILIGTDPDADRVGLIIKIPADQREAHESILERPEYLQIPGQTRRTDYSWMLLDADTAWTALLWYRLKRESENNHGKLPDGAKKFIALSHTTTDALVSLGLKWGLGIVKTWVGFAIIAEAIEKVWEGKKLSNAEYPAVIFKTINMDGRSVNIGAFEQSNGFSILGGPPLQGEKLGENGHVRDKDGTFAAILLTELAAYAKSKGTTIFELIDENIYLDPDIGLFITYYEPVPYWGQFEGPTGMSEKVAILKMADSIRARIDKGERISFGQRDVVRTEVYRTGKYDELHRWEGFPDEGIRYYFDAGSLNHLTIRPSGTSQCLRFHVQMKADGVTRDNIVRKKIGTWEAAKAIVADARRLLGVKR
ncbi:MAG: hypothetical protein HY693_00375 [Deltaproteobacteria bacterium]|nr:hypothetical protein [Deltaproteobacteria bacterium]